MSDDIQSIACKRVWLALINLMFADAMATLAGHQAAIRRDVARTWLTKSSPDLSLVCALAGVEPDRVRAKAIAIIEKGEPVPRSRRANGHSPSRRKGRAPGVVANFSDAPRDRRGSVAQDSA